MSSPLLFIVFGFTRNYNIIQYIVNERQQLLTNN